jgi:GH25 family lysozyme M1 (1,4-beta-N-acetylmuramidase)
MTIRFTIALWATVTIAAPACAVDYVQGIDVSHWQGAINWNSVKNGGIKFAFCKATEGVDFVDANFHQYMTGAIAAGVPIGPYHFARTNSGENNPLDAVSEADDFVDAIEPYYQTSAMIMRPVLDLERIPDDPVAPSVKAYVSQWVRDFNQRVESRLGVAPIIYVNGNFAQSYLEPDIAQYDLWFAKPTSTNTFEVAAPPTAANIGIWDEWTFWQWTWTGNVGGISPVDRDVFEGTMQQLAEYIPTFHAGDYNRDGAVDAADYVQWRKTSGQSVNLGTRADGNLSGVVDPADYDVWKSSVGKAYGGGSGSAVSGATPEPASTTMLVIAIFAASSAARRVAATARR